MELTQETVIEGWRKTSQLYLSKNNNTEIRTPNVCIGSGFFLSHKNQLFYVTADHCIHPNDWDNINNSYGKRLGIQHLISIPTHNNFSKDSLVSEVVSPSESDFIMNGKIDEEGITFKTDIAFCNGNIIGINRLLTPDGKYPLLHINENDIADPTINKNYFIVGCIHYEIDSIKCKREPKVYNNIKLKEVKEHEYVFSYDTIKHKDWEALSGSPVFDYSSHFIGMLVSVNEEHNLIYVLPAKTIIQFIDNPNSTL